MKSASLIIFCLALLALPLEQYNFFLGIMNLSEAFLICSIALALTSRYVGFGIQSDGGLSTYILIICALLLVFACAEIAVLVNSSVMDRYAPPAFQQLILRATGIGILVWCALVRLKPSGNALVAFALLASGLIASLAIIADSGGLISLEGSRRAASRIGVLSPFGVSATGLMSTKGSIALLLAAASLCAYALYRMRRLNGVAALGTVAILVLGALASGSRTPLLALLVLPLGLALPRLVNDLSWSTAAVAAACAALVALMTTGLGEALWGQFFLREGREPRTDLFLAAWRTIQDHPVFGVGPHYTPFASFVGERVFWNGSHTIWLQLPLYGGVLGWLLGLGLLAGLPFGAYLARRHKANIFPTAMIVLLLVSSFYQPLQSAFTAWCAIWGATLLLARAEIDGGLDARRR
ncbi:MAG: hypothetical protein RKE49_12585 [Oceanicaulis sp.]